MCWDWGRGGYLLQEKIHREEEEMREGRGGSIANHELNIINDITDIIIPSVTSLVILSVKLSCHRTICFFELHYNTHRHSLGIYRENFSVGVYWQNIFFYVFVCICQFSSSDSCIIIIDSWFFNFLI